MAFPTGFGVTGPLETIFDVIPVARMRVGHQTAFGTMALETFIPIGMTSLTGSQIFAGFTRMAARPLMARQHRVGMAALALLIVKGSM